MKLPFIFPKMCTTLQDVCFGIIGFTLGSDLPLAEHPKATHIFIPHVPEFLKNIYLKIIAQCSKV